MTTRTLHLAKELTLPLDAVSRTFGILAVRGAGKSNTAAVMAEEMFAAHLPFCVIDPVGSWYGLRSSSDGKAPGLPIPIFGGKHGDVPLERGAGELLADLIVEKRLTCVLDLSRFESESAKKTFLLAFAQRLCLKNENPLHLFLEEADDYIPQKPMRDEAQLLRAWENIVRRGRARGLGMTLITQRSAAVAKMVLTQVETLFAMRTTGPQDIAAIEAWVKYHQVGKDVLSTLAGLEDGEAWVWSPHYLKTMSRHQIRRRETFDSGATPKNMRAADTRPPATLADINLDAIQHQMAATIEKAKADDPKELRRQIAELKKQATSGFVPTNEGRKQEVKPVLTDADRALLEKLATAFQTLRTGLAERSEARMAAVARNFSSLLNVALSDSQGIWNEVREDFERRLESKGLARILGKLAALSPQPSAFAGRRDELPSRAIPAVSPRPRAELGSRARHSHQPDGDSPIKGGKFRAMLVALAQAGRPLTESQIAARAVMSLSGTFDKYLGQMRTSGWVTGSRQAIAITDAGLDALGAFDPLPTGADLRRHWLDAVGGGKKRAMLQAIIDAYPAVQSDESVASCADMALSGTFDKYLGQLRTLQLVEGPRTALRASEELFSS